MATVDLKFMDTAFFSIADGDNTQTALKKIIDNQRRMVKQLRFTLENLDGENFNAAAWDQIFSPIYARIKDDEGRLSELSLTAGQLSLSLSALQGDMEDLDGDIATVAGTIATLSASVSEQGGQISAIITNVGSGGTVNAASIVAAVNAAGSGVMISADHINLTGYVTFTNLSTAGQVTINGGNITAGTIAAARIAVDDLQMRRLYGWDDTSAWLRLRDSGLQVRAASGNYLFEVYEGSGYVDLMIYGNDILRIDPVDGDLIDLMQSVEVWGDLDVDGDLWVSGVSRFRDNASFGTSSIPVNTYFYGTVRINGTVLPY